MPYFRRRRTFRRSTYRRRPTGQLVRRVRPTYRRRYRTTRRFRR